MSSQRVVIYRRVSKTTVEGKSVDGQLAELREWAQREDWTIVAEHRDDGISASKYANGKVRDGWVSTMELITTGEVDLLVVWEISRATRDRAVWSALLAACAERDVRIATGGRVHDPSDPDDGFMMDLMAALAVRESAVTSKRIRRTVRRDAAMGLPYGKIPFGYRRVYENDTRKLLRQEPHPEQAPIVREIAKRLLSAEALYSIALDLNRRGVPAPRGGDWEPTQVKRVAISANNAGLREHKDSVVTATWEPLISVQDHHILKAKLTDPIRKTSRDGGVSHLLSGIAECGVCGSPVRAKMNSGHESYSCVGDGVTKARRCVSRSEFWVDAYVTEYILGRLDEPDARAARAAGDDGKAAEAAREAEALQAQLDSYIDQAATLSPATLAKVEARLQPLIEDAKRRATVNIGSPLVDELASSGSGTERRRLWDSYSIQQRREVVRALVRVRVLVIGKGVRPPATAGAVDWDAVTAWTDSVEITWR
ncbi:MAG: recombinase family protein [Pseudonocardiaceae bacterium]